ncbi:MAG: HYR domain-containing protein, partial [Thermoanaerobaculia bacterium]|nr:HYR domain-containing protein [Thermoanaerobaculia bacterium]
EILDNTPPALSCPDNVTVDCTESTDPTENQSLGSATASDACGTEPVEVTFDDDSEPGDCPELLRITRTWRGEDACGNATICVQIISVYDTQAPTFTAPQDITLELDADCSVSLANTGDVTDEDDNCSGDIEAVPGDETEPGPGASEYVIIRTWTLTDDCGNTTIHTQTIAVVDNMLPQIDCPADLTVEPNGEDCTHTPDDASLDPDASDNCGVEGIAYTLSGATEGSGEGSLEGVPFNEGETLVTWTVTDVNGNSTSCTFTVTVTECLQISGTLIWEGDDTDMTGVKDGTVALTGDDTDTDGPTPADGSYTLIAGSGTNFVITPTKPAPPADPMNGVSTLDALLIQQYIVGMYTFPDAYKMIAADVNQSNGITTLDASIIRQAILGSSSALAWFLNTPWRFVPTPANTPYSLGYIPPANPFSAPIPSTRVLSGVTADAVGEDFYGIKTGDVNATGDPLLHPVNDQPLLWKIQDQRLEAGKELLVVFRASQFNNLGAYQMALRFDTAQLQLLGVEPLSDALKLSVNGNFGLYNAASGEIRHVWIDPFGKTLAEGEQAFALRFSARQSGAWLHDVLGLKPKTLAPEAYTVEHATGDLKLIFTEPDVTTGLDNADPEILKAVLFQNRPNPFEDHTVIGFFLPEGCDAQLRVLDITGRELFRIDGTYSAGYHEETVYLRDLGTGGMLWYELTTPKGKQARKMVAAGP